MPWRGSDNPDDFPTLGWDLLRLASTVLPSPADPAKRFRYTDEQARIILEWFRVDPLSCRFVHNSGLSERAKGWGKSPFAASLAILELVAPVVPDGWDANGNPVGKPWGWRDTPPPWVRIAAVSEDQTDNTYRAIREFLTLADGKAADTLRLDVGLTRILKRDGRGDIAPVTASAGAREGERDTFAVLDETHLWTPANGGTKLAGTLRRNVAKMRGRTFETTNAPMLGMRSVAERSGMVAARSAGILYDCVRPSAEPQSEWSDTQMLDALREVYGDSWWVDLDRILAEIRDPRTDWEDALRFFFNVRSSGAARAVDAKVWDRLRVERVIGPNEPIGLGFDGSGVFYGAIARDATVLRACTADGYAWTLGGWERPEYGGREWTVPRGEVEAAVHEAFARYRVGRMFCDPPGWRTEIEGWARKYGAETVLALDTNQLSKFAAAVDRWRTAIREGTHTHDGDDLVTRHVKAAHLRKLRDSESEEDGRTRYVIVKGEGDERRRIDGAIADVLALEAATTMPAPRAPLVPLSAWV